MTNQPVMQSLLAIGNDADSREDLIRCLLTIEKRLARRDFDVREEVTGPLVDAMHRENTVLRKALSNGMVFDFYYRSKIARDFVMSEPRCPDHVWEPQTTKLLTFLAHSAKEALIGGAYFGDHAVMVARTVDARGGRCHAFEPNHEQYQMLRHNAALNGVTNLAAVRKGLWDESGKSLRLVGFDSFAHPEEAGHAADDAFETITIDDYAKEAGIDQLGLIMLDLEGAESRALQGARRMLGSAHAPAVVFEIHRSYVNWDEGLEQTEIAKYLRSFGYTLFAVRDFNSNAVVPGPIELVTADSVYLAGPPHGFNMVAVKDPAIFDKDAFRIVRGVSPKLLRHRDPKLHQPLE